MSSSTRSGASTDSSTTDPSGSHHTHVHHSTSSSSSSSSHSNSSSSSSSSSSGSRSSDRAQSNDVPPRSNSSSSLLSPDGTSGPSRGGRFDHRDTCSYHAPPASGSSCRQPRTCHECLNADVAGASGGCLLAPSGFCEDMTRYETSLDFRRNVTGEDLRLTGWYNYFPSVNATYCAPTDDACVRCRGLVQSGSWTGQSFTWRDASSNVSTEVMRHFCRGLDGCVCVMACESDNWAANMPVACDDGGSASNNGKQVAPTDVTSYSSMLVFFLVLQVMLLAVFMYRRGLCRRVTQAQPPPPRPEGPYNNVDAIASPSNRLRLSGWSKMQSALIERESKQRACYSQQPQGIASAEMENPAVQIEEGRNQTRLLSSQGSPQDSGTARAVYVGAQDDPRQQHSSRVSDAQQIVGIGGATAAGSVERIVDTSVTRIERAS